MRIAIKCSPLINHNVDNMAWVRARRAVDRLPTWVRWIIVAAVGLSPNLSFWLARVLGAVLRRKQWLRFGRSTPVMG